MEQKLVVHSIDTFGTHDGPGIRLVVFLQGCNLKCKYCQNPDTICRDKTAKKISNDQILARAESMRPYFSNGGGVTFSGGEPMLQSKALLPLVSKLSERGIHTNIDTNGTVWTKYSRELLRQSDLVMFDIKNTTSSQFLQLTGSDGLQQLLWNIQLREAAQKTYWLRYVLVPGYTDSEDSLQRLRTMFAGNRYLSKIEILPYHKLGEHKWKKLNWPYELEHVKENTPEQLERVENLLKGYFTNFLIRS